MLRKSSLVECVSVLHGTCLQGVKFFFIRQYMCSHVCQKNPNYTFYTIKSSLTLAYKLNNRLKAQVIDKSYLSLFDSRHIVIQWKLFTYDQTQPWCSKPRLKMYKNIILTYLQMLSFDLMVFSQVPMVFSVFATVFSVNHGVFGNLRYQQNRHQVSPPQRHQSSKRGQPHGNPEVQKWDRELLRLEGVSVGCAGCINSQPTRPLEET